MELSFLYHFSVPKGWDWGFNLFLVSTEGFCILLWCLVSICTRPACFFFSVGLFWYDKSHQEKKIIFYCNRIFFIYFYVGFLFCLMKKRIIYMLCKSLNKPCLKQLIEFHGYKSIWGPFCSSKNRKRLYFCVSALSGATVTHLYNEDSNSTYFIRLW